VAGALITSLARKSGSGIYPVDSEHSAIFQCLAGEDPDKVEKLILTASGGPFRGMSRDSLHKVTSAEALRHPNWCMGNKITIDSASLMNKGLGGDRGKLVVWHRDRKGSRSSSTAERDTFHGAVHRRIDKGAAGPAGYAAPHPVCPGLSARLPSEFPRFSFEDCRELTFEKPDTGVFRNLALAYKALHAGGNMPCIMNAANEIVVEEFLKDRIGFMEMPEVIEETMGRVAFIREPAIEDFEWTDREARDFVRKRLSK